jgi:hypothetical protein
MLTHIWLAVKVERFSDKTYALGQKKPGFLQNLRAATIIVKKTGFLVAGVSFI